MVTPPAPRRSTAEAVGTAGVRGRPRRPLRIAVANGTGDGTGLDITPGRTALRSTGLIAFPGSAFSPQGRDDVMVAHLERKFPAASKTVDTSGFPEPGGTPGGTLDSYQITAELPE